MPSLLRYRALRAERQFMPTDPAADMRAIRAIISSFFFNFNTALISQVQGPGMDVTLSKQADFTERNIYSNIFFPIL